MIKEIAQFMQNLSEDFKNLGVKPKEGIHILLNIEKINGEWRLNLNDIRYERYSKKMDKESEFLKKCISFWQNSWMIDTNKCFDTPAKSIHSCSPFCVGFKREHIYDGAKYKINESANKKQISERFEGYFEKAFALLNEDEEIEKYKYFREFFTLNNSSGYYKNTIDKIVNEISEKRQVIENNIKELQLNSKDADKSSKTSIKTKIEELKYSLESVKELSDSDYIIFYLNVPLDDYKAANNKYLSESLFNTSKYNTHPDDDGLVYGTSNFFNGFNSSMPFLIHQTATFNITKRISNVDAKLLFDFQKILSRKVLPNPLMLCVFQEELQGRIIGIFQDSGFKFSYKEIIEKLWDRYNYSNIGNYYLLFYQNSPKGIVFKDFDFVSKFKYKLEDENEHPWEILDLFGIEYNLKINNIFEFQNLLQVIFNNNLVVKTKDKKWKYKYFDDIDEMYCKSSRNYLLIMKYRKAFYDFIYKTKRQSIGKTMFDDIMLTSILEDIRLDEIKNGNHNEYFNIRKKLNIWFSLYEKFITNNLKEPTMASKLKNYQQFIDHLAKDISIPEEVNDEYFAFAAGQVIDYIRSKSKSADKSYLLLEPYLQQSKCSELKKAISNEFARYKHENYSRRFENAASFVLSYDTKTNMKKLLPELLAGVFSKNQLFSEKIDSNQSNNNEELQDE